MTPRNPKDDDMDELLITIDPDYRSLEQRILDSLPPRKDVCCKCGTKIPPGKAGRMCKPCRQENNTKDRGVVYYRLEDPDDIHGT